MENKVSEISEMTTDLNSNSETKFDHFTTTTKTTTDQIQKKSTETTTTTTQSISINSKDEKKAGSKLSRVVKVSRRALTTYASFIGPGLLVSVAYMDPGNYATGITAGASNRYSLLFIVLLADIIAIFLQVLCIKLGCVTGYDLARCCREYLPKKLNWILWILAECAIISTDVAEVIGSATALNILLKIPLPAGVVITIVDVIFVLIAYRTDTSLLKFVKIFEYAVGCLVMIVVICFAVELSQITANVGQVFRGFVPSKEMFDGNGMTVATSVIGSTVMIHSLFLGSGLVQPRMRDYDVKHGYVNLYEIAKEEKVQEEEEEDQTEISPVASNPIQNNIAPTYEQEAKFFRTKYKPSYKSICYCLKYSKIELIVTLATIALFVNAAIVIIAGATLYGTSEAMNADLYTIHSLLSKSLSPAVGTIFMVALLSSGQSAGVVCTIAGQMVGEGHINWTLKPWMRRILTRAISIIPCLTISVFIGKNGLGVALNISQIIISILLPPLTAPLIYFTCCKKIMKVELGEEDEVEGIEEDDGDSGKRYKYMTNSWLTTIIVVIIWLLVAILNVYAIYQMAVSGVTGS